MKRKPAKRTHRQYPSVRELLYDQNTEPWIISATYGVPVENVRAQYYKNALQLAEMALQALKTGKTVNGYTATRLLSMAIAAAERSNGK